MTEAGPERDHTGLKWGLGLVLLVLVGVGILLLLQEIMKSRTKWQV